MQIISKIALITINETLVVQVISFLIFMVIMNRLMFRPLRSTMSDRETYLSNLQNEISEAEEEIETITAQLREQEARTRAEAGQSAKDREDAGKDEANRILASSRTEFAGMMEKAKNEIDARIQEARKVIRTEAETLAIIVMEKVLERRLA